MSKTPCDIHVSLKVSVSVTPPELGSTYVDDFESSGTEPEGNTQPSHEGGGYPIEDGLPPKTLDSGI